MSATQLFDAAGLPPEPLDAAARFHTDLLPQIRDAMSACDCLNLRFEPADHTHDAWRLAAVQELAREGAPGRVNAVVAGDPLKAEEVANWLVSQPGITGQILVVDGKSTESD